MFSFLKKKITSFDVGTELLKIIGEFSKVSTKALQDLSEVTGSERLSNEILYLNIFAADVAVSLALGNSDAKEAVCEVFHKHMVQMSENYPSGTALYDQILDRLEAYDKAIRFPRKPLGEGYPIEQAVGETFAELCGMEGNALVIWQGSFIFHGTYGSVLKFVQSVRIV